MASWRLLRDSSEGLHQFEGLGSHLCKPSVGRYVARSSAYFVLIILGSAYRSDTIFDLKTMNPYGMDQLLSHFQPVTPDIVLYLPRSADLRQLARVKQNDHKLHVVHYCVDGASKVRGPSCCELLILLKTRPCVRIWEASDSNEEASNVDQ